MSTVKKIFQSSDKTNILTLPAGSSLLEVRALVSDCKGASGSIKSDFTVSNGFVQETKPVAFLPAGLKKCKLLIEVGALCAVGGDEKLSWVVEVNILHMN